MFLRYVLKWSLIIALPIPAVWTLFTLAHFIPWWQLRAAVIWGCIWLPLVVLSAAVDYARATGGGLGFSFKRKKRKKKEKEYYDQKSALDATIEANP